MRKYYIYILKPETPDDKIKKYAVVDDVKAFIRKGFNPATMDFTGIMVEAESPERASEIYQCPKDDDGYFMVKEPLPTRSRRKKFTEKTEELSAKLEEFKDAIKNLKQDNIKMYVAIITREIAKDFKKLNRDLSLLSDTIKAADHEDSDISIEEIYVRLRTRLLKQYENGSNYKKRNSN